jgi:hypothetical protein
MQLKIKTCPIPFKQTHLGYDFWYHCLWQKPMRTL